MPSQPVAYFLTFTTYGTWLQGREEGSVSRGNNDYGQPVLQPDESLLKYQRRAMSQPEYRLDEKRREVVLNTIVEVAKYRGWKLWAVHVRSNHVHIIVTGDATPEKLMRDFKAWCSRRIREATGEAAERNRWTEHGSTRYLWMEETLRDKIVYVLENQGERMAWFDGSSEPDA